MKINIEKKLNALLKKYLPKISKSVAIDFGIGSAMTIQNSKINGKETKLNPLSLNQKEQQANIEMIESLIKDVNSEVAKKINYLVNKSVTNKWSNKMLSDELQDLFDKNVPGHFTYKKRFDNIAITESFRILNESSNKTAKRLGAKKKYLLTPMDNRTAEDSKIADRKYGNPDDAIPIDKPFTYTYKGIKREFMLPPDRPRDRSMVLYTFD